MIFTVKDDAQVKSYPCLMLRKIGSIEDIVLVKDMKDKPGHFYVTVLSNGADQGQSYDLKGSIISQYKPLPKGYKICLTN